MDISMFILYSFMVSFFAFFFYFSDFSSRNEGKVSKIKMPKGLMGLAIRSRGKTIRLIIFLLGFFSCLFFRFQQFGSKNEREVSKSPIPKRLMGLAIWKQGKNIKAAWDHSQHSEYPLQPSLLKFHHCWSHTHYFVQRYSSQRTVKYTPSIS